MTKTTAMALFAAANLAWLAVGGVHMGGDTGLYVDGARRLLQGEPLVDREPSYTGYVAVVAASQAIGAGLLGVILFQITIAALAAGAVYRMGMELGGPAVASASALLFTADFDVNRWHSYVLADSLYLSAFTVSVWLVYRASLGPRGSRYLAAMLALVATALIRPEGWFLIPAAGLYCIVRSFAALMPRAIATAGLAAACVIALVLVGPRLTGNVAAVGPGEMLRHGQTIWDYEGWRLSMAEGGAVVSAASPVSDAVSYALRHPYDTGRLMLARLAVHLAHVRPYYSWPHNLVIVLWLAPIYAFTALALRRGWHQSMTRWSALAFSTQALVVSLTHADWDGRYLAHVMPIVYPFAAAGAWTLLGRRNGEVTVA